MFKEHNIDEKYKTNDNFEKFCYCYNELVEISEK
jgi:hypothetical protein